VWNVIMSLNKYILYSYKDQNKLLFVDLNMICVYIIIYYDQYLSLITHTHHFVCIYIYSVFRELLYKLINSVLLQELTWPLCSVCAFKIIIIAIICKIYRGREFPLITSFLLYQLLNRVVLLKDVKLKFVGECAAVFDYCVYS